MLLTLDANSAIDISDKMATFQNESLENKITNGIDNLPDNSEEQPKILETLKDGINKPEDTPECDVAILQTKKDDNVLNNENGRQPAFVEDHKTSENKPDPANNSCKTSETEMIPAKETEETKKDSNECLIGEQHNGSLNGNCDKPEPITLNKDSVDFSTIVKMSSNNDTTMILDIINVENKILTKGNTLEITKHEIDDSKNDSNTSSNQEIQDGSFSTIKTTLQETTCEGINLENNTRESLKNIECLDESSIKNEDHKEAYGNIDNENIDDKVGKNKTCNIIDCDGDKSEFVTTTEKVASEALLEDNKYAAENVTDVADESNSTQNEVKDSTANGLGINSVNSALEINNAADSVEDDIEMVDSLENISKSNATEEKNAARVLIECEPGENEEKGSKSVDLKHSMENEEKFDVDCVQEKIPNISCIKDSLEGIVKSSSESDPVNKSDEKTSIVSKVNTNTESTTLDDTKNSEIEENKKGIQANETKKFEEKSTSEVVATDDLTAEKTRESNKVSYEEANVIKVAVVDSDIKKIESIDPIPNKINMETGEVIDDVSAQGRPSPNVFIELTENDKFFETSNKSNNVIKDNNVTLDKSVGTNIESTTSQTAIIATKTEEIMDVDEVTDITQIKEVTNLEVQPEQVQIVNTYKKEKSAPKTQTNISKKKKLFTKLSNTLDILSDDDEPIIEEKKGAEQPSAQKQCINLDDDDDIMLISEGNNENQNESPDMSAKSINKDKNNETDLSKNPPENKSDKSAAADKSAAEGKKGSILNALLQAPADEDKKVAKVERKKPLIPENFLKTCKKNLVDMTRDDLEELCVLKIVESIVDRSVLSEIKTKLKSMAQTIDEYKTKTAALSKQNRDLQIVLKSVQEEQKKGLTSPIVPLKITRSVGLQVVMIDKSNRKKPAAPQSATSSQTTATPINKPNKSPINPAARPQKPNNQQIPVPRLVPANNAAIKTNVTPAVNKGSVPALANVKASPQKAAEKRPRSSNQSMTVDLTDDEPPAKVLNRASPAAPVRLVPAQNLLTPQRQAAQAQANTPRKVFIPIGGPQNSLRPGSAIVMKTVPHQTPQRQRAPKAPPMVRLPSSPVSRISNARHPAPLPDAVKQYQPPNWKTLPPAPDLKLSKVENGIVISWKIEGYHEDSYEEIASYQLFAYQETSAHPSTALWKKIGDVKALPLPMACTLTQFMAGYKYYFAVRAVDVRSRFGPFSLPGSILLLNKA